MGRTVQRAARLVGRGLPQPSGRPKQPRGRASSRRPGSTEARPARAARRVTAVPGVTIRGPIVPRYAEILTTDALTFVATLHRHFEVRRRRLVSEGDTVDDGAAPAAAPAQRIDRSIEIAGPVALASEHSAPAADGVAVAGFSDADARHWLDRIEDHVRPKDWSGDGPQNQPGPAGAILRPRGWQLTEDCLVIDGQPIAAALFDLGLSVFHAAAAGTQDLALHVLLPDNEVRGAAELWDDVLLFVEQTLGLTPGTIKIAVIRGSA